MIPASRKLALGFCCEPLEESGYTWSHTTTLGDLLFTAERKYGARDKSWTILGIEICGLHPQIWYPRSSEGARFVSVMLSDAARMNPLQAGVFLGSPGALPNLGGGAASVLTS